MRDGGHKYFLSVLQDMSVSVSTGEIIDFFCYHYSVWTTCQLRAAGKNNVDVYFLFFNENRYSFIIFASIMSNYPYLIINLGLKMDF